MTDVIQAHLANMHRVNYNVDHVFNDTTDNIKRFFHENRTNLKMLIDDHITKTSSLSKDEYNEINSSGIVDNKPKSSLSAINCNYQRKKSRSLKLTANEINGPPTKKTVHFADDFGLDLVQIKMFHRDESPYIPHKSFKDLPTDINENISTLFNQEHNRVQMIPQFENPIFFQNFLERVSQNKIILEQANAYDNQIQGTIKLISLSLNKHVKIRLTTDNWMSFRDYGATCINNSFDGVYDRFSFIVEIDRDRMCVGNNIQFCICYQPFGDQEYWDNNYQQNYRFPFGTLLNELIFCIDGSCIFYLPIKTTEIFNPKTGQSHLCINMNGARTFCSACIEDEQEKIYVFGGTNLTQNSEILNTAEIFHIEKNTWIRTNDVPIHVYGADTILR